LYTVVCLIAATVAWASWAKVDRIVTANGSLITREPPVTIQPVASSLIREIRVKFGQIVRRNDVLATLDPTLSAADLAKLQARADSLAASIERLSAERDDKEFTIGNHDSNGPWGLEAQVFRDRRLEFAAKTATFDSEREKLKVQQANNVSEIQSLEKSLKIAQLNYNKILELSERGSETQLALWKAELDKLDNERTLEKAQNDREQLLAELELNQKRRTEYVTEWRSKVSSALLDASGERDEAVEELAKARRINELVELRVPDDLPSDEYVVLEIADRSPGSAPKPGESLFKLVAVKGQLEAEVEIPARDIGLVKTNNPCRIKVEAFPYQKHGTLDGTVETISEGAFQKGETPSTVTMYRSRIRLGDMSKLKNMPEKYRLIPGMQVTVEIRAGERRVIEYFLYPILRGLDSSIREP
jgi:HlyD family secretion protein